MLHPKPSAEIQYSLTTAGRASGLAQGRAFILARTPPAYLLTSRDKRLVAGRKRRSHHYEGKKEEDRKNTHGRVAYET
jgi:hypothetical protein